MEILNLDLHQILKFREFGMRSSVQSIMHQSYLQNSHPYIFFPATNSAKDAFLDVRCFSSFSSLLLI